MADDGLDELLGDLEGLLSSSAGDAGQANSARRGEPVPHSTSGAHANTSGHAADTDGGDTDDELQGVLDELTDDDDDNTPTAVKIPSTRVASKSQASTADIGRDPAAAAAAGPRCDPVLLGGAATVMGRATRGNPMACNAYVRLSQHLSRQ